MAEGYKSINEIAELWDLTPRRVQGLCTDGRIKGAVKIGRQWAIPADVERPVDNRETTGEYKQHKKKPRKSSLAKVAETEKKSEFDVSFAFGFSHDLRTQMNAILGSSSMLRTHLEDPVKANEYLNNIDISGKYMLDLIDNILELERIANGSAVMHTEIAGVHEFLDQLLNEYQMDIQRKHLNMELDIEVHHEFVKLDKSRVRRICLNMISNAIKYTPDGGTIKIFIEEEGYRKGVATYSMTVDDNGIGMTDQLTQQMFSEEDQLQPTYDPRHYGSSINMILCKKLMDYMGGDITVKSTQGLGTTIIATLALPVADLTAVTDKTVTSEDLAALKGKRILVAEDNELNRDIVKEILVESGLEVVCAEDGIVCIAELEKAEKNTFDLILMDLQMPNMDGLTAARVIRNLSDKDKSDIPIIAMTASVFDDDKKAALVAGMNGFVGKPINLDELFSVVKSVLQL